MNCLFCGKELTGKQLKYCSKKCKNKYFDTKLRPDYSKTRGRDIKWQLIKLAGGKCSKCGYNKNLAALRFHHINPLEKSFELDQRACANRSFKELKKELNKCILLCMNCHIEIHNKDLELSKDFISALEK